MTEAELKEMLEAYTIVLDTYRIVLDALILLPPEAQQRVLKAAVILLDLNLEM